MRRTPLTRRTPLRARLRPHARSAGECAWKHPRYGFCVACGVYGLLHGHHIVSRQMVRRFGGDEWDERNRLDLDPSCHMNHEFGMTNRKLSRTIIPGQAVEFAVELMGEDLAMLYLMRHYREVGT